MPPSKKKDAGPPPPVVRYAPLGELKIYQVQEHELDQLASSPASMYFNFAVFLMPIGVTLVVTLTTTQIESDRLFLSYVAIAAVTIIVSIILFVLWFNSYRNGINLVEQIRNRMPPPEPIVQGGTDAIELKESITVTKVPEVNPEPSDPKP